MDAPLSQRLSQDERRLPGRGPAVRRDRSTANRPRPSSSRVAPAISAPTLPGFPYRCGDEADIRWIGRDLGCEVVRTADRAAIREEMAKRPKIYPIQCASAVMDLPGKEKPVRCEFQALRVGPFLLLTIPGEPFVEYGFQIEKAIADRAVPIVVGYANGSVFYVCTARPLRRGATSRT